VLHPTSDLAVLNATHFLDQPDVCLTSIPNRHAAETLIDKKQFYRSLQSQGIPYPTTFFTDEAPLETILPQVTFPVLIKPSMSQLFQQRFRTSGFIANTPQDLRHYLRLAQRHDMEVMIRARAASERLLELLSHIQKTGNTHVFSENARVVSKSVRYCAFIGISAPSCNIPASSAF
jgi:carbamoylphosphate synthase large subunit